MTPQKKILGNVTHFPYVFILIYPWARILDRRTMNLGRGLHHKNAFSFSQIYKEEEEKFLRYLIPFHHMTILAPPVDLNIWKRRHELHNFGKDLMVILKGHYHDFDQLFLFYCNSLQYFGSLFLISTKLWMSVVDSSQSMLNKQGSCRFCVHIC